MKLIGDQKPELIIDAGHGGTDPGADGNNIVEKDMTLAISLYQYERFRQVGVTVALTRDTDITLDPTPRTNLVKSSGAKFCISNHINAASSVTAAGAEIIYSIHSDGKLASAFAQALAAAGQMLRQKATYCKKGESGADYFYMHRLTGTVATHIIEYGFCTNVTDAGRLHANWRKYAEAIVKGYCEYTGRNYTKPAVP